MNTTLSSQVLNVLTNIKNVNSTILKEYDNITTYLVDINSSMKSQFITLLTNIQNLNSTTTTQFLNVLTNINNLNNTIMKQFVNITSNIKNLNSSMKSQFLNILTNIKNLNSTILSQFTSISASIKNLNTTLSKQILSILANITNVNSSLAKQLINEGITINDTYSKIGQIYQSIYIIENNILSEINQTSLNISTKTTIIKDLVSMTLNEENGTFAYILKFGTPSVIGESYSFPVFVSLLNGQIANLSVTQQAAKNLNLYYITGNQTLPLMFSVSDIKPGSFVITIDNITPSMEQSIASNNAVISAQGSVQDGNSTHIATGLIGSSNLLTSPATYWNYLFIPFILVPLWDWFITILLISLLYTRIRVKKERRKFKYFVIYSLIFLWLVVLVMYRGGLI